MVMTSPVVILAASLGTILRARWVMDQNKKRMVRALNNADMVLIMAATFSGPPAKLAKKRPNNMKKGAPGGWPTSSLYAVEINSPQSQKLAVGSMVKR